MALKDNLVSHWKLNETSGTRNDSHGTNHLTDNNTVGYSASGKLGNAAEFVAAQSEELSKTNNTSLEFSTNQDFTICMWAYRSSNNYIGLIGKPNNATYNASFGMWFQNNGVVDGFIGSSDGSTRARCGTNIVSLNTWVFLCLWRSSSDNIARLTINNANEVTSPSESTWAGTDTLYIGSGVGTYMDGRIDSVSIWKRVLTAQERTDLYNSGNGLDYDSWDPGAAKSLPFMKRPFRHILVR
jgi:hypothetical protein